MYNCVSADIVPQLGGFVPWLIVKLHAAGCWDLDILDTPDTSMDTSRIFWIIAHNMVPSVRDGRMSDLLLESAAVCCPTEYLARTIHWTLDTRHRSLSARKCSGEGESASCSWVDK